MIWIKYCQVLKHLWNLHNKIKNDTYKFLLMTTKKFIQISLSLSLSLSLVKMR